MDAQMMDPDPQSSKHFSASALDVLTGSAADQPGDALQSYQLEGRVLDMWDQLHNLKLEISLLEAQNRVPPEDQISDQELDKQLADAEKECLEARAAYALKQSTVADVFSTGPMLRTVHSGNQATPTERSLAPLLVRRDVMSIALSNLSSHLQSLRRSTTSIESTSLKTAQENRLLSSSVMTLSQGIRSQKESIQNMDKYCEQLKEAREDTKLARKRWRIMKYVLATTVLGSGVDWARDNELLQWVADLEEDDGDDDDDIGF